MKLLYRVILFVILSLPVSLFATNTLTVQDPTIWGTKNGYIDKATLVVEPLGGYVEQSLYLTYSDHNQFAAGSKLEIVHRFELPEGSVINDLWLWIGDSVMQAVMTDTWTARSIYDSIVVTKHDPAFLTKNGNQYELHIYPLTPGGERRVKINFITPTKWFGNTASAVMPFNLLASNNATVKPLEVFFRVTSDIWGVPSILEAPAGKFQDYVDTLGYKYKYYKINDISSLASLNLTFQTYFTNGYFFDGYRKPNDYTYFQLGISPDKLFNLVHDTTSQKCLIALDLSGGHNKDLSVLIPNLKGALKSALKSNDYFNVIIAGVGEIKKLSDKWIPAVPDSIDAILNAFSGSAFADSISKVTLPTIVYCDVDAANGWEFPGIDEFATVQSYPSIQTAAQYFSQANIIAAYRHGFDDLLDESTFNSFLPQLDSFFAKGGHLLSYYDLNRDGHELLASHYINGLGTLSVTHDAVKLYRNINGNIGSYFPETIVHESAYFLTYNDSTVKIELMDQNGRPAVISKKINNGLLVVSGLWELTDDGAMKKILDVPLLGLNASSKYFQLVDLLNEIKTEYKSVSFYKVFLFSNSDSLFQQYNAVAQVTSYLSDLSSGKPVFNTINLLDGNDYTPASLTVSSTDYFGSGYLTKVLSDSTYGLHFETHTNDWNYIDTSLSTNSAPLSKNFTIIAGDSANSSVIEMREINPIVNDPNKPKFYIGSTTAKDSLVFNVSSKFMNLTSTKSAHLDLTISKDTTERKDVIPAMLGNEKLKDLFATTSYDTAQIVSLALKYRLLCDYTALLALEPNDTLHFLQNPNDEGSYPTTDVKNKDEKKDSLSLDIFPNPFNLTTTIIVSVEVPSEITLEIYNILGQKVREFNASGLVNGKKSFTWDGKNSFNRVVSSGIYFARAVIKASATNKQTIKMKKMILLK
ncbi:MAG: VIT domain-containing protein [Ignavibacteriaceae bacterium]|nr:VIT domain-containing protein [Ignavibacteriaceae bacterium]